MIFEFIFQITAEIIVEFLFIKLPVFLYRMIKSLFTGKRKIKFK